MIHSVCTICTDVLSKDLTACPCGHVYHSDCVSRWFSRSKTCPTCRKDCSSSIKLFLSDLQEASSGEDIETVRNQLRNQMANVKEKELENKRIQKECAELRRQVEEATTMIQEVTQTLERERSIKDALTKQVSFLNENTRQMQRLDEELKNVKKELLLYDRIKTMISGSHEEAQDMLRHIGTGPKTANELASQLIIMKRENEKMRDAKKKARSEKEVLERDLNSIQHKLKVQELECSKSKKTAESLQDQLNNAEQEKQSLKKKLDKLQQSFQSPSPRNSIINRLLKESPAPLQLTKPALTFGTDENFEVTNNDEQESMLNRIQKAAPISFKDMISPVHPGVLRQKRKRAYFHLEEDPGRLHQGYNGLGGHSTVLMPAQSILRPKKKVAKPVKISKFVCNNKATNPPLPQLSP